MGRPWPDAMAAAISITPTAKSGSCGWSRRARSAAIPRPSFRARPRPNSRIKSGGRSPKRCGNSGEIADFVTLRRKASAIFGDLDCFAGARNDAAESVYRLAIPAIPIPPIHLQGKSIMAVRAGREFLAIPGPIQRKKAPPSG